MAIDRYSGFVFPPVALAEDVDLDPERRREILFTEAQLGRWTHWEVLGIAWNAPAAEARAAYVEKVKVFHPDRYPGKRLGSYKARLGQIFRRLTEARDVLVDERRAEYVRATAPPAEFAKMEARKLEDERRAQERRARLGRQNPLLARAERVQELVRRGREAFEAGRFAAAANDLLLAQGMDPKNLEIAALASDAKRKAGATKASEIFQAGLEAEVAERWTTALERYREALEADPGHVRSAAHGARAAIALGDLRAARTLATAALEADPRAGIAHEAIGRVLEAEGNTKEARRELEAALELDPRLEGAKERLKKLRWSFLR